MGGAGAITKTGVGTFQINGTQTFTDGIIVNVGKSDQAVVINLSMASGSNLDIDLGNTFGNPTVAALDLAGT